MFQGVDIALSQLDLRSRTSVKPTTATTLVVRRLKLMDDMMRDDSQSLFTVGISNSQVILIFVNNSFYSQIFIIEFVKAHCF